MVREFVQIAKNVLRNSLGGDRPLEQLIADGDISRAMSLFDDKTKDIEQAIKEYNPETHEVMSRKDKNRRKGDSYITEKLPRNWPEYINEVALFFLLANPIEWKADKDVSEELEIFKSFLSDLRFDSFMRQGKRIAGAETQCAKMYHFYQDDNFKPAVKIILRHKEDDNHDIRPLFDQYKKLMAIMDSYYIKLSDRVEEHCDIHTSEKVYRCKRTLLGAWEVVEENSLTGKINIILNQQKAEHARVQSRIHRDEMLDSRIADTNNYFADPIAAATADVLDSLADPDKPGKVIRLSGPNAKFEYVNPPTASDSQRLEKENIRESILQDSFTPDFSFKEMVGMGTLSGEAIRRAMILGYIKRSRNIEIYHPLVDREKNLILSIMMNVTHIHLQDRIKKLSESLTFEFAEPFNEDLSNKIRDIADAVNAGILSVEEGVKILGMAENYQEEIDRLKEEKASKEPQGLSE